MEAYQGMLGLSIGSPAAGQFLDEVAAFRLTRESPAGLRGRHPASGIPVFTNEFWTSAQRQAHSLHEVPYRACFKPQLPRFFIERLTQPGDFVYDPFLGRGTTAIEAALLDRIPVGVDLNPVSAMVTAPRLSPPEMEAADAAIDKLNQLNPKRLEDAGAEAGLLQFYHPDVLARLNALRLHFRDCGDDLGADEAWVRMVALTRLTGHSNGYCSVYTLPPNQATSPVAQARINRKRNQVPPLRDVPAILRKKSRALMRDLEAGERVRLSRAARKATILSGDARAVGRIKPRRIALTVTSPPFLNTVGYREDNWLRLWFGGFEAAEYRSEQSSSLSRWRLLIGQVFAETYRLTKPQGFLVCEVGEIAKGKVKLEDEVVPLGATVGFEPICILVNAQTFTKTANCWGVSNNKGGTNTNRMVVFQKV